MSRSAAFIIIKAVRFATDTDIQALQRLTACHLDILTTELTLRILLSYLPESTDPNLHTSFLQDLIGNNFNPLDDSGPANTVDEEVSEEEARRQVRALNILSLNCSSLDDIDPLDIFTRFLLIRAHRIDTETGCLPLVQTLLEPFLDHSEYLRTWFISTLLPLLRLEYEYYPHVVRSYRLEEFEKLEGGTAIETLLSADTKQDGERHNSNASRDLKGLVGPWMYGETHRKRQKLEAEGQTEGNCSSPVKSRTTALAPESWTLGWAKVNDWIFNLSLRSYDEVVHLVGNWDGPGDVDYGGWDDGDQTIDDITLEKSTLHYAQTGLATMYATDNVSLHIIEGMYTILNRSTEMLDLPRLPGLQFEDAAPDSYSLPAEFFDNLYPSHILWNALLNESNPLTSPSKSSTSLSHLILCSTGILCSIGHPLSYRRVANLSLFSNSDDQNTELRKVLHTAAGSKIIDKEKWASLRPKLLWLRNWGHITRNTAHAAEVSSHGIFHHINLSDFETEILGAFLTAGRTKFYPRVCIFEANDTYRLRSCRRDLLFIARWPHRPR